MTALRGILIALGLGLLAVGAVVMLDDVPPDRYFGIAVWVGTAIVLHDGILAPVVVIIGLGAARYRDRFGRRGVAVAQGALLVGAILTTIALPAIIASARGNPNPTILDGSYVLALAITWMLLATVAIVALQPWKAPAATLRDQDDGTARTK